MRASLLLPVLLCGCNAILGIEKGDLDPDAAIAQADSGATDSVVSDGATDSFDDSFSADTPATDTFTADVVESDVAGDTAADSGKVSFDIVFPDDGDTGMFGGGFDRYMCNTGDVISGERVTPLASVTKLAGTFELASNDLETTCAAMPMGKPTIKITIRLNGTLIGNFNYDGTSGVSIPLDFAFPAVSGPNYILEYKEVTNIPSGCGCSHVAYGKATLTLTK